MKASTKRTLLSFLAIVAGLYGLLAIQFAGVGEGILEENHPEVQQVRDLMSPAQFTLLDSYAVTGNMSGDIERGFRASITGITSAELESNGAFQRGDSLAASVENAVDFVLENFGNEESNWVPGPESVKTSDFYLYPMSIDAQNQYIDSARLVIVSPVNQSLYYFWLKF
ncbi:MAG: hypothetical protein MI746_10565 [Pseudomonadales bacterium]|nr:hypothetical protein [Pseudomonadales bacterium]